MYRCSTISVLLASKPWSVSLQRMVKDCALWQHHLLLCKASGDGWLVSALPGFALQHLLCRANGSTCLFDYSEGLHQSSLHQQQVACGMLELVRRSPALYCMQVLTFSVLYLLVLRVAQRRSRLLLRFCFGVGAACFIYGSCYALINSAVCFSMCGVHAST
jgi:hypothetical protein